jgi:hypothetical protein
MVDFGLQPFERMVALRQGAARLVWIDHHKTHIYEYCEYLKAGGEPFEGMVEIGEYCEYLKAGGEPFEGVVEIGLTGTFDPVSACELTWMWFAGCPYPQVPLAVRLLGRYDVWDHGDKRVLPFQYGMRLLRTDPARYGDLLPRSYPWRRVFENRPEFVEFICSQGRLVIKWEFAQNFKYAAACAFETELDGLRLIAANAQLTNSKLFDSVWDPDKHDAMCIFGWRKGQWTVSLYSTRDDVDVSVVCKARGGGGHKGAAGFQCRELPEGLLR